MSGLQVGLGSPNAQNAIRAMFPSNSDFSNDMVKASLQSVQKDMKSMSIKDEKSSKPGNGSVNNSSQGSGPKALVIAGPSGVGKGTLIERLKKDFPNVFGFSVSHTTRDPRPGEENGVHYHFTQKEAMEKEIANGEFIEHANVHGNLYGTSKKAVETVAKAGKICILDIDVQGCRSVRKAGLPARFVFVAPPSFEELERRLRGRGTETEDKILKRLGGAKAELDAKDEAGLFDHVIVNDDIAKAYEEVCKLIADDIVAVRAGGAEGSAGGESEKPMALVVAGPSGVGKGTLIERLKKEYPAAFGFSVSHTTRGPRPGEEDGVHYHFTDRATMEAAIAREEFIEYADVHGNMYGTSKAAVEKVANSGKICILDIDVQGCRSVRKAGLPARFVFIAPPSFEELERRLRGRGTETEDKILKRLGGAKAELDAKDEAGLFDHVIVNDDVEQAFQALVKSLRLGGRAALVKIIEADIKAVSS